MLTVLAAISLFERKTIRERQAEGIAIAKRKGAYDRVPNSARNKIEEARRHAGTPARQHASTPARQHVAHAPRTARRTHEANRSGSSSRRAAIGRVPVRTDPTRPASIAVRAMTFRPARFSPATPLRNSSALAGSPSAGAAAGASTFTGTGSATGGLVRPGDQRPRGCPRGSSLARDPRTPRSR